MRTVRTAELVEIDERRLLRRLDDLAQRGALAGGGMFRALYAPSWTSAMELVTSWLKQGQLFPRRDAVGNVWGRIEGSRGGRVIVTGSHIDTVRGGGALDGALGVVAGVEAVTSLWEHPGRPTRILECVAICEEEGSRFNTNFWGARAIADRLEPGEAEHARDGDGMTLADAMRTVGLDPANVASAVRRDIDAFVELHIEQGPVLDENGPRLGVVTTIAGTTHLEVIVHGQPDHAGAMAMTRRKDALVGASAMAVEIADLATRMGHPAVATVGTIAVEPSQVNVVPGLARFSIDARGRGRASRARVSGMGLLVRGGTLLPVKGHPRPMLGGLLVSGTRIGALGKVETVPLDTETVDVSGCVIMPGIVQTHVHLVQTLFRGLAEDMTLLQWLRARVWPLEAALDEASLRASVRLGILEMLMTGTTTVLDMGTTKLGDIVAEELVRSGLRARFGQAMMDAGEGVPPALLETTRGSLDAAGALTKRWHKASSGRIGYVY